MIVKLSEMLPQLLEQRVAKRKFVYDPVQQSLSLRVVLNSPVTEWTDVCSTIVKDKLGEYWSGVVSFDVNNTTLYGYTYSTYAADECEFADNIQAMIISAILLVSLNQSE